MLEDRTQRYTFYLFQIELFWMCVKGTEVSKACFSMIACASPPPPNFYSASGLLYVTFSQSLLLPLIHPVRLVVHLILLIHRGGPIQTRTVQNTLCTNIFHILTQTGEKNNIFIYKVYSFGLKNLVGLLLYPLLEHFFKRFS